MHTQQRWSYPGFLIVGLLVLLLCGCSSAAAPGGNPSPVAKGTLPATGGTTPTPTPAPCATTPSAPAEAWVVGSGNAQVMGSINGGAATTLSHFVYPLGLPNEGQFGDDSLDALAWSPDGQHLAVAVGVNVGPTLSLFPYIVDTTTHAVTRIILPGDALASEKESVNRIFAWADDHTLLIFGGFGGGNNGSAGTVSYSYDTTADSLTPLPGVTSAYEGVVRCSTLFYLEVTALTQVSSIGIYKGAARLHRYDLTSHSEIGSPITLGDTSTFNGAEGDVSLMGWDAAPDGTRIAYQQTTVSVSGTTINLSSRFIAANADGSAAGAILTGATSNSTAYMAISPDGQTVVVTNAQPTPTVLSGSMSGGAAHYYAPDAEGPPVWLVNNQFEAGQIIGPSEGIELWVVNTGGGREPGTLAHSGDSIPATLA